MPKHKSARCVGKSNPGNLGYVDLARSEGAEVIGGERLNRDTEGFYQAPAMFLGATKDMRSSREEIFGPVPHHQSRRF